jgi:Domain of unknown function (DUF4034)
VRDYLKWIIFLVVVTSTPRAFAQQQADIVGLIHKRDFDALEMHFNAIEVSFERGDTTEFALLDAYKSLYMRTDQLSDELLAWTASHPKSYAAHLARGTYYRKLGEYSRGNAFARDVPQPTMMYVHQVFDIAAEELKTAVPLTAKPYLAVLNLLNIARYEADADAADRYLEDGNKILPNNILVRARYLDHLKPRWGGSYEAMSGFVARCKKEGLPDSSVGLLSAMINDDKGLTAETQGNVAEAAAQYKLALTIAESAKSSLKQSYLEDSLNACRKGMITGTQCL